MIVRIYCIAKSASDFANEYERMALSFGAEFSTHVLWNSAIAKAQSLGDATAAQNAYAAALKKPLKMPNTKHIILDTKGAELDSMGFAELLKDTQNAHFYIGGAFGFAKDFIAQASAKALSLSRLTLAHKVAYAVLSEQIYRALSLNAGHPYHK